MSTWFGPQYSFNVKSTNFCFYVEKNEWSVTHHLIFALRLDLTDQFSCFVFMFTDLVPFHMMLVEQCQPLRHSSLHNQKQLSSYEGMEYILQDHNYDTHGEGDSQMGLLLVKQEVCIVAANHFIFPFMSFNDCHGDFLYSLSWRKRKLSLLWSQGKPWVIKQVRKRFLFVNYILLVQKI